MVLSQIIKFCKQNPVKIKKVDREFVKCLNFKSLKFPVHQKEDTKIKQQNHISISKFGYEDKTYTSKQTLEKHDDLLFSYWILKNHILHIAYNSALVQKY